MKMKTLGLALLGLLGSSTLAARAQSSDSIAHTLLVANYDYSCRSTDAQGKELTISYGLTLQIGQDQACTLGRKRHDGEKDQSEQLLYVPTTWQNYPTGRITSLETVPSYRYLTDEAMRPLRWTMLAERDSICGYLCQKASAEYAGRKWTAWFAESLPTRFGPWRLSGLPGLILRAVSEDGIHRFECLGVEAVKEAISYRVPEGAVKCPRSKFVALRNRLFGNPNYLTQPYYYIKPEEISSMTVLKGAMILGDVLINMKPAKFQPLDY